MTIVNNTVGIPIWHTILLPVTVVTVPHDLHEGPALAFERMIMNGAEDYLSSHGSDGSYDNYARSKKQADGIIKYLPGGTGVPKAMIAIEVGYTEDYNALCENKNMLLTYSRL
ncbi:hypothetical protein V1523DRAFT_398140 [Lipomyces doorenjongii]